MIKKKGFFITGLIVFSITLYIFYITAESGGFEKALIPEFIESSSGSYTQVPLLKTHWKQDSPYSQFTPGNELLGCWSVAFAQVLAFYHLQASGEISYITSNGIVIQQILMPVDWDKIVYSEDSLTPSGFLSETARYCYQVALVMQKDFGYGEYMDINQIPLFVEKHFKCTVEKCETNILKTIQDEIISNRPVIAYFEDILSIKIIRNGHAVVVDGFTELSNHPYIHVNFGWGGKSDGWYDFFQLSNDRKLRYVFTVHPVTDYGI